MEVSSAGMDGTVPGNADVWGDALPVTNALGEGDGVTATVTGIDAACEAATGRATMLLTANAAKAIRKAAALFGAACPTIIWSPWFCRQRGPVTWQRILVFRCLWF